MKHADEKGAEVVEHLGEEVPPQTRIRRQFGNSQSIERLVGRPNHRQ